MREALRGRNAHKHRRGAGREGQRRHLRQVRWHARHRERGAAVHVQQRDGRRGPLAAVESVDIVATRTHHHRHGHGVLVRVERARCAAAQRAQRGIARNLQRAARRHAQHPRRGGGRRRRRERLRAHRAPRPTLAARGAARVRMARARGSAVQLCLLRHPAHPAGRPTLYTHINSHQSSAQGGFWCI